MKTVAWLDGTGQAVAWVRPCRDESAKRRGAVPDNEWRRPAGQELAGVRHAPAPTSAMLHEMARRTRGAAVAFTCHPRRAADPFPERTW